MTKVQAMTDNKCSPDTAGRRSEESFDGLLVEADWSELHGGVNHDDNCEVCRDIANVRKALRAYRDLAQASRPFYGAECPSYPACNGGCGLGCTKEIDRLRGVAKQPSNLPKPETMLTYASILEKPQYWVDPRGQKWFLATGEIVEAACAALRHCAETYSVASTDHGST